MAGKRPPRAHFPASRSGSSGTVETGASQIGAIAAACHWEDFCSPESSVLHHKPILMGVWSSGSAGHSY